MSVTVFTWDMFKFGPHFGVGHAAMYVQRSAGDIYISFWPAEHSARKSCGSTGLIHFMKGDKDEDGTPSWASKSIENLNEERIAEFWKGFDTSKLDYKGSQSTNVTRINEGGKTYNILLLQHCATTVLGALLIGADADTRLKIKSWLIRNAGTNVDFAGVKSFSRFIPHFRIPTVTPADIRELVKYIWDDF